MIIEVVPHRLRVLVILKRLVVLGPDPRLAAPEVPHAAKVGPVHPQQDAPSVDRLHVDRVEDGRGADRLDDVSCVALRVRVRSLVRRDDDAVRVGKHDLGPQALKVGQDLLQQLLAQEVEYLEDGRVVEQRRRGAHPPGGP